MKRQHLCGLRRVSKGVRGSRKKVKGAAEWPDHMELFPKVPREVMEGFDRKNVIIPLTFEQDHSC